MPNLHASKIRRKYTGEKKNDQPHQYSSQLKSRQSSKRLDHKLRSGNDETGYKSQHYRE